MGTKCAPSYANLFLGGWEPWLFSNEEASVYLRHSDLQQWYIDDILIFWTGPVVELQGFIDFINVNSGFIDFINVNSFNLFFTLTWNQSLPFLYLYIEKMWKVRLLPAYMPRVCTHGM